MYPITSTGSDFPAYFFTLSTLQEKKRCQTNVKKQALNFWVLFQTQNLLWIKYLDSLVSVNNASFSVKPEGWDPGHMWAGIWPLLPFPPSGIWLKFWVPGLGRLLFLRRGMGPSHFIPCACLCASHLGIEVVQLKPWKTAVFNEGKHLFLYLYQNTTSHYSFSI